MGTRQCRRQDALAAEREEVARRRVVQAEHGGEEAADHQQLHRVVGEAADELGVRREGESSRVRGRDLLHVVGAVARDQRPRRDDVEPRDDPHGDVRRARHGAVRILGLLGVDRGLLEADEGVEGQQQPDAGRPSEDHRRLEDVQRERREALLGKDGDVHHQEDQDLKHQRDAQDLRAHLDLTPREQRHGDESRSRTTPATPDGCRARSGDIPREQREHADHRDRHRVVGDDGDERGGHPDGLAQASRDVGVEAARVRDMAAHGGIADGEEQQHRAGQQPRPGAPTPLPKAIARGRTPMTAPIGATAASTMKTIDATPSR